MCWTGGEIICCNGCPRAYHYDCLDDEGKAKSKSFAFYCSQHACFDCAEKTTNAGGMLFRCRWCEVGYCEDCLDWDRTDLVGDSLPEYRTLGFGAVAQAYYIVCPGCKAQQHDDPRSRRFCAQKTAEFDQQLRDVLKAAAAVNTGPAKSSASLKEHPSRAPSLTDATTLAGSGITTPAGSRDLVDAAIRPEHVTTLASASASTLI